VKPLPDAVKSFVMSAPVCRLATVRANGDSHIIPVCPAFDGESTVYVDVAATGTTGRAIEQADSRATVLFDEYFDDWSKLKGVVAYCRVERPDETEHERAWALLREKYPQGVGFWNPRLTLALRIENWVQWGITTPPAYSPE
jgi:hypothetical protein